MAGASLHAALIAPLETHPIHLGTAREAEVQREFPKDERAMQWYVDYATRARADGEGGRLVSMYSFTEDWAS